MSEQTEKLEQLEKLEQDIKTAWLKEGIALHKIKTGKLYEARGYKNFSAYYQEHFGMTKQVVHKRMEAALSAISLMKQQESLNVSQNTYFRLSKIDEVRRQDAFDKSCEIAVSQGSSRVTANHVDTAIIEILGGYAPETLEAARKWGFSEDIEKLNILQTWFEKSRDSDSKFWAVYHSGILDPSDDLPVCEFATATIKEIAEVAERWKQSRILADSSFTPIIGIVNSAELIIDGMRIVTDSWQGKRVKFIVKILKEKQNETI